MRKGIHPEYQKATVTCVNCGEVFEVGSTVKDIRVEVCSKCHPFYTGQETYTQAAGRVERFKKRYGIDESSKASKETASKDVKVEEPKNEEPQVTESKDDPKENQTED